MASVTPEGEHNRESTGTPRWVKVFGAVTLIVLVIFLIVLLTGGGNHGPSRHAPAGVTEHGQ